MLQWLCGCLRASIYLSFLSFRKHFYSSRSLLADSWASCRPLYVIMRFIVHWARQLRQDAIVYIVYDYGLKSLDAHASCFSPTWSVHSSDQMPWDGSFSINGGRVTSSSFTARMESMPRSYEPETPLFPPSSDIPTVRTRSRIIAI